MGDGHLTKTVILSNRFFCPAGATRYPSKREIWHGGADRKFAPPFGPLPVPNFTFIRAEMWEYSPQNCQNFEFWP